MKVGPLGYGHEIITMPSDWKISRAKVYIEIAAYDVYRPGKMSPAVHVYVSGRAQHDSFPNQKPYCSNGLRGHTATIAGMTHVTVSLPALSEDVPYDNAAGFTFKAGDRAAAQIVRSLRLKGYRRRC
jgi:hypothetical protein